MKYVFIINVITFIYIIIKTQISCTNNLTELLKTINTTLTTDTSTLNILKDYYITSFQIRNENCTELISTLQMNHFFTSLYFALDFLCDSTNKKNINTTITNSYFTSLISSLSYKKKSIIKISPIFQYSQNHTHIYTRIKFSSKTGETPNSLTTNSPIQNLTVNLTTTNLELSAFVISSSNYLLWYYRKINLFGGSHPTTLVITKENENSFIISFMKVTPTMYWSYGDLNTDDHKNIYIWFDMYEKYNKEYKYDKYINGVEENVMGKDYKEYSDEENERKRNRGNRVEKGYKEINEGINKKKNYCFRNDKESCYFVDYDDWNYWYN